MEESILVTIKKLLGMDAEFTAFDTDIIIGVNTALMMLSQLAVGPKEGYKITGDTETWYDFLGEDHTTDLEAVKTHIYITVKLLFDPPTSSFVVESLKELRKECEWRILIQSETVDFSTESELAKTSKIRMAPVRRSAVQNDFAGIVINCRVDDQTLTAINFPDLVSGSENLVKMKFTFNSLWTNVKKVAVFNNTCYVPIINGMCSIPPEITAVKNINVRVVGDCDGVKIPTNTITIKQR